ncbi:ankyrin repeat-containing domain protein [Podospora fimiseda]|uniref:Ankyrin repeat-containing domain protein n=1 Tax=Podospora fimiseda TaxID=252190 RepID=A0AAN6YL84_9PEZI|nr:ankyrin repeat-containing domain protein [Podospora fimiseda]
MSDTQASDIQNQANAENLPGDFQYRMANDWGPGDDTEEEDPMDLATNGLIAGAGGIGVDQTKQDTEFWRACHQGKIRQVKRLLELGANVNTKRKYYMGRIARYSQYDNVKLSDEPDLDPDALASADMTIKQALEDDLAWWGERKGWSIGEVSAIFVAIVGHHFDVAEILLDHMSISLTETYTPDKRSAFYQAVLEEGSEGLLRRFLALSNADTFCNITNYRGWTPLHWCADQGGVVKMRLLLQGNALVDAKDNEGYSPLTTAVRMCPPRIDVDITRLLLMYGADVNLTDNEGNTALHEAAKGEFARLVNLLLTWGANEGLENNAGKKAIDLVSDKRTDVTTLLDPANVRKVKKDRRDPWKTSTTDPCEMCKDFSLNVTFGRRSLHGSGHVRTYKETMFDFVYGKANGPSNFEDILEDIYIDSEKGE